MVLLFILLAFTLLILILCLFLYAKNSILSEETLVEDLTSIKKALGTTFIEDEINAQYSVDDVIKYYTHTTDRDYKLLELFVGPGLHSRLELPLGGMDGGTHQSNFILAEIRAANARSVLEIGSGRGHCSLFLAQRVPDVQFKGVDLTARHVSVALESAKNSNLKNVDFFLGDATKLSSVKPASVDFIFGIEALCHIDTNEGAANFMKSANKLLRKGGRIVFFDGFRAKRFNKCSANQRKAMKLAECGFKIRAMPSKKLWVDLGIQNNMKVIQDVDLTRHVLPFWILGWRVARIILLFPRLIRFVLNSSEMGRETVANLLSVATTAHAMRDKGSAEYGYLVLEKQACRIHSKY